MSSPGFTFPFLAIFEMCDVITWLITLPFLVISLKLDGQSESGGIGTQPMESRLSSGFSDSQSEAWKPEAGETTPNVRIYSV